jgi:hypothetical protein
MYQRRRGFWPWVLVIVGMAVALIVGLMLPWQLRPVEKEEPEAEALSDFLRDQYVVWVSDSYAANGALDQAQERLAELGEEDAASSVAELAARYMESGEEVDTTRRLIDLAQALGAEDEAMVEYMVATAPTPTPTQTAIPTSTPTESPLPTATSTPSPTVTDTPGPPAPATPTPTRPSVHPTPVPREWDRRLDWFGEVVRREDAQVSSGEWYWRLIRLRWEEECGGRHHIYVEVLDENGNRSFGQTVVIEYGGVPHYETYPMPDKLGEEYAYNFPMSTEGLIGAYNVYIGSPETPGDRAIGLGLGTRMDPYRSHHTCFWLTFQRTYQP